MSDAIVSKLLKIPALAGRSAGGEKQAAQETLERLSRPAPQLGAGKGE